MSERRVAFGAADSWPRVRALFETAAALPVAERAAFLQGLEPADAALRGDVEELLAADACSDAFLEPPLPVDRAPGLVGRRVGAFRIVRAIGSGGMGAVWEAEQDEPRRKVAVKTMRWGLASEPARRRFRFEAELLASLRHPAIAQVFGAGVLEAEDGGPSLPWFALEFVEDARALTRHADERGLDLPHRLRLFQTVCAAVQHAHQRGVVHRDLKAANILVDRDGGVKVIDFGIARLSAGDGATRAGEVVGTLETMSPEQVAGRLDEVDARTDVYALGVVLYELCAGQRPHCLDGLSLPEAARRIAEVEPPPPSRLRPSLPREVDWIVATAMAKDPARRYPAAIDIAREIDRLLAREPLQASPPSRVYRLRKFCQRHRRGVVAGAVAFVALAVGALGAAFGLVQRQEAAVAAASARAEADLAGRFAGQFIALFERLLPDLADGAPLTQREFLDHAAAWIRADLQDRPQLQARLLRTVGQVHNGLGAHAEARALLEQSVALARADGERGARDLVEGLVRLGLACRRLDDYAAAEAALREALAVEERLVGRDSVKLGPILNELGILLADRRPDEALACYRRAYDNHVARWGGEDGDAAMLLANMGSLELRGGRPAAAKELFERALPLVTAHHGANDPRTGALLGRLAEACQGLGELDRALELQRRDVEISKTALGADHPDLGMALLRLAQIETARGDLTGATRRADEAAGILEHGVAASHPARFAVASTRGRLLLLARRTDEALALLRDAVARPPDGDRGRAARLRAMLVLSEAERHAGRLDEALARADAVLADPACVDERLRADAHWTRALALARRGESAAARAAADCARREQTGTTDVQTALSAAAAIKLAAWAGDEAGALALLEQAILAGHGRGLALDPELEALRASAGQVPSEASPKLR